MGKIAIGVDVSKEKSTVTAVKESGEIIIKPHTVHHTISDLDDLVKTLKKLIGESKVVMEATGHYNEPLVKVLNEAGFFVTVINPRLMKDFTNNTLRIVKTDKADAVKTARYGLYYWHQLRRYAPEAVRAKLKICSKLFDFYSAQRLRYSNILTALLDQTYPSLKKHLAGVAKANGHIKWVDFAKEFWHCECVSQMSEGDFTEAYRTWCTTYKYLFNPKIVTKIYESSFCYVATMEKNAWAEALVAEAVENLTTASRTAERLRSELLNLAQQLPEWPAVAALYGVGKTVAAQLIAEIGDVRRFKTAKALVAFAGIDPGRKQSGNINIRSTPITKNGSPALRSTLMMAVRIYKKNKPANEPVYLFFEKKRSQGKPHRVSMIAAMNMFLRIYYARINEYLEGVENDRKAIST